MDDTGENVSQYNQYINDYSLTYWAAKNYDKLGSPEYIGFAQYRRILMHEDYMLQPKVIACNAENYNMPLYKHYSICHNKSDLDFVVNMMKDNFSPMLKNFVDFLNQSINFGRNIFIMHRDKFMLYSDFICKCIDILTTDLLQNSDIKERDKYQKRAIGFLLERLTGFWIYDQMVKSESNLIIAPIHTFDINSPYQRPGT